MTENELTDAIIGAAIEVHRRLGPGYWSRSIVDALHMSFESAGSQLSKRSPSPWTTMICMTRARFAPICWSKN